jgi:hypothetical protein
MKLSTALENMVAFLLVGGLGIGLLGNTVSWVFAFSLGNIITTTVAITFFFEAVALGLILLGQETTKESRY